jgi:alpha-1,6-mannosyltransferase
MLANMLRSPALQSVRSRLQEFLAANYVVMVLAGAASLSFLLYWLAFVRPFDLFRLYETPLLDLQKVSSVNPLARWLLLVALVEQGVIYAIAWRVAQEAKGRAAWIVIFGGALASGLVLLIMYPYDAADIFDYIMHGRMTALYGANPFVQVISEYPHDVFRAYVGWPNTPSAYGPLWEILAAITVRLAGDGIIANVVAFKVLSGLFLAGSIGLVAAILRRVAPERALVGVLLLAWNPVVLYETLGHGHNDIVIVFWMLGAAWALLTRHYTLAILALLAGALVKFVPVLLLPAAGLVALRGLHGAGARLRFLAGTAVAGTALVVLAYAPFWENVDILGIERRQKMFTSSLPAAIYVWLQSIWGAERAAWNISTAAAALTGLFAIAMGWRAWREASWLGYARSAVYTLMFYLLITGPWFQNWYAIWPLGLAVLLPPGHALRLVQVFVFASLSKPLLFAPMFLWVTSFPSQLWRELRMGPAIMSLPWLYAVYAMWQSWWSRRR